MAPDFQTQADSWLGSPIRTAARVALVVVGLGVLWVGFVFWLKLPIAIAMWPWPDGKLSYLFVASILLAEGATMLWTAVSMELNAARGGALGLAGMSAGIALYMGHLYGQRHQPVLLGWVLINGFIALSSVALAYLGRRETWHDARPVHKFVRISFLAFSLALFLATVMLFLRAPIVFPWKLSRDSSFIFGCLFLASAVYFLDGWRRPGVANVQGQLVGFFVYDLVLIPPYLQQWPKTSGGFRISLMIYLIVLFWSAALAIWFWLSRRARQSDAAPAVPRSHAAGNPAAQATATLHRFKRWLDAPVVFRRQVSVPHGKPVQQTASLPADTGAAALVLHVCWLSILLGLAVQIVLLVASTAFGHAPKLNPLIVDLAQRITWSTIVCASISVAMVASKLPVSFMGLAGVLSASVGFKIARAVQKGVGAALGAAPAAAHGPSPLVLGIIKAVEYGCLAALLAWMVKRKDTTATVHAAIGLTMGVFFGTIVLAYTYWSNLKLFTVADVVSRGLNEVLFPIGCSLVLFATEVWAKQWKSAAGHATSQPLQEGAETAQ